MVKNSQLFSKTSAFSLDKPWRFLVEVKKIKSKNKIIFRIKEMDEKANLLNFKDEFEVYNYSRNYIDVCREYLNDRKKYKLNLKKTKYRII